MLPLPTLEEGAGMSRRALLDLRAGRIRKTMNGLRKFSRHPDTDYLCHEVAMTEKTGLDRTWRCLFLQRNEVLDSNL